jgi:hypothetical protein
MQKFTVAGIEYELEGDVLLTYATGTARRYQVTGKRKVQVLAAYASQVTESLMPSESMPRTLGKASRVR